MRRVAGVAALVFSSIALSAGFAAEAPVTVVVSLESLKAEDVAVTLRAIAGVRGLEIVDERTIRITDAAETVELAKTVTAMAEHPNAVAEEIPTRSVSDGSVIASVQLRRASPREVLTALRQKVRIRRIATNTDPATVMVRDEPDKVAAALAVIRQMEAEAEPSRNEP